MYVTQKGPGEKEEGISWKEKQRKGQRFEGGEINWHWEGRKMKSSWRDEPIRPGPEQGGSPSTYRARQPPSARKGERAVGSPLGFASWSPQVLETPFAAELSSGVVVCFPQGKEVFVLKENIFFHKSCKEPQYIWCTNASWCLLQIVVHHASVTKGSEAKNFLKFKLLKNKKKKKYFLKKKRKKTKKQRKKDQFLLC